MEETENDEGFTGLNDIITHIAGALNVILALFIVIIAIAGIDPIIREMVYTGEYFRGFTAIFTISGIAVAVIGLLCGVFACLYVIKQHLNRLLRISEKQLRLMEDWYKGEES